MISTHRWYITCLLALFQLGMHSMPVFAQTENEAGAENRTSQETQNGVRTPQRAVAEALEWLAAHQRADGVWDRRAFDRCCPEGDRCSQTAIELLEHNADVGISALCALAFLGVGHTHEKGPYADHLSKVFSFILAQQLPDGSFSRDARFQLYNDAIAVMAIAEAYIHTGDRVLRDPLERGVARLVRCQQRGGGWDITDDLYTNRNDTTVTTWVLMALKSAHAAGASVPLATRLRILEHYDNASLSSGRVWYADKARATASQNVRSIALSERRYSPGMTAAGLYARSALGLSVDDSLARKQIDLLVTALPNLDERARPATNAWFNEYYWYYGTLAMFNVGGEPWDRWQEALRRTVLEHQERPTTRKGKHRHAYGSWPAFGRGWGDWGRAGGRIYATAINTLSLEASYRYTPAYLSPYGLIGPAEGRDLIDELVPGDHGRVLSLAIRLHEDAGEPVLVDLLESPNVDVKQAAAIVLAERGSPMGAHILKAVLAFATGERRTRVEAALSRLERFDRPQTLGKITDINSQARMILFDTNGLHVYYGQPLRIIRDGRPIATLRVNRRFKAQRAAAARIESEQTEIRIGDLVAAVNDGN